MSASLEAIQSLLSSDTELPYCTGTVPLDATNSTLFYQGGDLKAEFIDFANPTEEYLKKLAHACQPATFGLGQKDVLDESYRKAGKMDATAFATNLSPIQLGILDTITDALFQGKRESKSIRVELYKLNVYGPGAFFKAHVDTPRSDKMFGSLVVILPTRHEGGSLIFRRQGREWVFDSAMAVSQDPTPHAAFVSFFSDVEHEVCEVTSGYRVTLTYNLYFADPATTSASTLISSNDVDVELKKSLTTLLQDPTVLPDGGILGFGLCHVYPFKVGNTDLSDIKEHLKGSDAAIKRVCDVVSLNVSLKAIYHERYNPVLSILLPEFAKFGTDQVEEGLVYYLQRPGSIVVWDETQMDRYHTRIPDHAKPIVWAKPLASTNNFQTAYVRYGNEASLSYAYGEVCLIVELPAADTRMREDSGQ